MNKIKIPFVVTREERAEVKLAYLSGRKSAGKEMLDYISQNLPRVINRLKKSDEDWMVEIAATAEYLYPLLRKDSGLSQAGRRDVISALHYLCHPFEVIPDHVPGRGYADDALVINTCIVSLRQRGMLIKH